MIEDSLRSYGVGRSILIDKNRRVIAGNKTLQECGAVGIEDLQIVQSDGKRLIAVQRTDLDLETDSAAKELAIADNRAGQVSLEWDAGILQELSEEIDLSKFFSDKELTELAAKAGLGEGAGEAPEAQIDKAEELREKWQTARGQIWEIPSKTVKGKAHRLACGDSGSEDDVTRLLQGQKASLMATDPPYGVAYADETGKDSKFGTIANDENNGPKLQAFLEGVFRVAAKNLIPEAAWYLWHAQMTQGFFAAAAAAANVLIHRQIIWVKPSLVMGHGDFHWKHELCFYGWVQGNRARWFADRKQTTVWEVGRENDGVHPTQKPIELFTRPMQYNTAIGEICYEPFAGSGTQFCAGESIGRLVYGLELEPRYCAVVLERLKDMGLEPRLVKESTGNTEGSIEETSQNQPQQSKESASRVEARAKRQPRRKAKVKAAQRSIQSRSRRASAK